MNIASTQYTLNTKSFEVYVAGCDGKCGNECHSKELWDFHYGKYYHDWFNPIQTKVETFSDVIDWIWILGGEPLLQNQIHLINLLIKLKQLNKPLVLFTRFPLNEVPESIKELVDFIKTGMYDPTQKGEVGYYGITLQTTNQKVWKKEGTEWI